MYKEIRLTEEMYKEILQEKEEESTDYTENKSEMIKPEKAIPAKDLKILKKNPLNR